ncbi:helix-turn-helix domain-containing protein [Microbispora sp. NPDC049125]|uniref:helix-turn-helix domain-containing protein n=1 Tax=Microbispora sp. NPDC049125 TaxID=3154929 RepID=UPI0034658062
MSETWTIGELAERAAGVLGPGRPVNGRVRDVPNERLIRWYTTIGLLDPPLARRGRVALYGRRHLLQLVAVKRRQAEGLSIAAIQAELAGATDGMLQRVAGLAGLEPGGVAVPESREGPSGDGAAPGRDGSPAGAEAAGHRDGAVRDRFWTRPGPSPATPLPSPSPLSAPLSASPSVSPSVSPSAPGADAGLGDGPARPAAASTPDVVLHGVRLAPGVTVLLDDTGHALTPDEVAALRLAAGPLLAALATLGLAGRSDHAEGITP